MASTAEIRQLTGLRGIAALTVALVHLHADRFALVRFFEFHDQAVDLFFCLSGFTLCMVYRAGAGQALDVRRYAAARFARIYPLYAVILLFCWWLTVRHLAWSSLYPGGLFVADTLRNLLLVNSWPLIGDGSNWDSPAWSLSVEAFCYIALFPVLFALSPAAARLPASARLSLIVLLAAVSFIAFGRYWDVQILIPRIYTAANPIAYWVALLRGITLFSAGWLIHGFWQDRDIIAQAAGAATNALALSAILILGCADLGLLPKSTLVLLAPPLVLGLAANAGSITARLLASAPLHLLGELSYAIYLLHEPLQSFITGTFPNLATRPTLDLAVTLPVLFLVSAASYYGFEKPARALIKRGAGPSRAARAARV